MENVPIYIIIPGTLIITAIAIALLACAVEMVIIVLEEWSFFRRGK